MINIKIFPKRRNTATAATQSSSSSSTSGTTTPTNDWFYFNDDNGFVTCRYPFASVDNIVAFGSGNESGGGSGGGSNIDVIDNLESTSAEDALSANMGRNLKALIDNIQTQGGGTSPSNVDWQNIQNKPSTYPPSAHTHEKTEINGLSDSLANLAAMQALTQQAVLTHANNNDIHVTAADKNIISQLTLEQIQFIVRLMQICTIDSNGNITFNGNVNSRQNVTAMV